jgi:hypothetical protein
VIVLCRRSYIQTEWDWRIENRQLELTASILNAIAWLCLCIPILQVAWIQSNQGNRGFTLHISVAVLAIAGGLTEFLSHIMHIGSTNAMEWIGKSFVLVNWAGIDSGDDIGWKTLEVIYTASRGMLLWVGAMEYLFLAGIFALLYISIRSQSEQVFSMKWATFGAILGVLCIVDFLADVLRFQSFSSFGMLANVITFLNHSIFFPIWIYWLGKQLPMALESVGKGNQNGPGNSNGAYVDGFQVS